MSRFVCVNCDTCANTEKRVMSKAKTPEKIFGIELPRLGYKVFTVRIDIHHLELNVESVSDKTVRDGTLSAMH